ncbi:MAG TPA: YdcF family protein [Micromonosporaceae bacterium]
MTPTHTAIPEQLRSDVETLWDYHDMHHELRPADAGIGLGSHDPSVAMIAVDLYHRGMFPVIVFTGANSPTTVDRFPRGEAIHYREYAIEHGVPKESILIETAATNTGQNITHSRDCLIQQGVNVQSVVIMSRPYQQRRAYATCKKLWPEIEVQCASYPLMLDDYVAMIGDVKRVIDMLVGDTQRIQEYPKLGFAIEQEMPAEVRHAFRRLTNAGFTSRLLG